VAINGVQVSGKERRCLSLRLEGRDSPYVGHVERGEWLARAGFMYVVRK
jgi:hypothetical protein